MPSFPFKHLLFFFLLLLPGKFVIAGEALRGIIISCQTWGWQWAANHHCSEKKHLILVNSVSEKWDRPIVFMELSYDKSQKATYRPWEDGDGSAK